jgi:chromosome segregation ATPase
MLVVLAAAPLAAAAQSKSQAGSYRCIGADGKRYYGSVIPAECANRPVEQLNTQGLVIKRIDPERAEKERQLKEATDERKRQEEAIAKDSARRNQALLATYTSEKDIEAARARALTENSKAVREVEVRIETIRTRQAGYQKDLEPYKAKGVDAPPKLRDDMKSAEDDLKAQENLLEVKKREAGAINARYDEDKKRYAAISKQPATTKQPAKTK